jgi:hypothetical protein
MSVVMNDLCVGGVWGCVHERQGSEAHVRAPRAQGGGLRAEVSRSLALSLARALFLSLKPVYLNPKPVYLGRGRARKGAKGGGGDGNRA